MNGANAETLLYAHASLTCSLWIVFALLFAVAASFIRRR
jgi:hypothetical protein